jgi:hypothetical protein
VLVFFHIKKVSFEICIVNNVLPFDCCFVWVWNVVSQSESRIQTEGVQEQEEAAEGGKTAWGKVVWFVLLMKYWNSNVEVGMDEACSLHDEGHKCMQGLNAEHEGKRESGRPRHKQYNTRMHLKETGWVGVWVWIIFMWLRTGKIARFFWTYEGESIIIRNAVAFVCLLAALSFSRSLLGVVSFLSLLHKFEVARSVPLLQT